MGIYSDVLLTVDYDRTLTAPDSTIPQRNLEAIRYFMENGGAFTVNTGRSVPMSRMVLEQVPVNAPLLLYNGSAAYDSVKQELGFCRVIDMDLWDTIRKCQELFPELVVELQAEDAHYCFAEDSGWNTLCDYNRCTRGFAKPGMDLGPFLKFTLYGKIHEGNVKGLFTATAEEMRQMDEAERLAREVFGEKCEIFRSGARIIDFHAKGVSKGKAARELQQRMGRKILVCVGDAANDLPMMRDADYAYAPADGVIADQFETVCNCADGAVADVIYEKIPKILKNIP